ncbi:unnamed protein product [Closterium sp. Naga37s-1]|nr:unnamed protein product [Closterium sp. Naga37s-1]
MALMNPMALMTSCAHQPHAPITVHASLFNPPLSLPLSSPPCSAPRAPRGQSSHRPVELIDAVLCRPSPCMHDRACITRVEQASPMELINAVPPVLVHSRVVACRGGPNPALGHPVEYINVDAPQPAVCKYCGLRYLQDHSH